VTIRGFLHGVHSWIYRELSQPRKTFVPDFDIITSFVCGFSDTANIGHVPIPALWHVRGRESHVYSYPFPRNTSDFHGLPIKGEMPGKEEPFKDRPRFGLTGLCKLGDYIFAGSWNGVYKIAKDFTLESIISNHLISDPHGIYCDNDFIYTCLTCKDALIISDHEGRIVDRFSVGKDLKLYIDDSLDRYDWRFISKQYRGGKGFFHFNYIQKHGDEILLTSRNLGSLVVIDIKSRSCHLEPINLASQTLLHDGVKINDKYYFTSVDGQIIIAENIDGGLYNRGLCADYIRLRRKPNWCRGIAIKGDVALTAVDGKYGSNLAFGIHAVSLSGKYIGEIRFSYDYSKIGIKQKPLYLTGFDIV